MNEFFFINVCYIDENDALNVACAVGAKIDIIMQIIFKNNVNIKIYKISYQDLDWKIPTYYFVYNYFSIQTNKILLGVNVLILYLFPDIFIFDIGLQYYSMTNRKLKQIDW